MDAIYVSANSFKVMGDKTSEFNSGRRVKLDCQLDGIKYATVVSSSYSSPYTTIVIDESTLTASLTYVWYGIIQAGTLGSLPGHSHDGTEGSGGFINIPTTFSGLNDTPTSYSGSAGLYLRVSATESGIEFSKGTDDHTHSQYVTWNFGSNTISGTGDIYCNDIYTASGTVYIGDLKLSTDGEKLLVDGEPLEAATPALVDLTDTPSDYDAGKYLISTVSGTEWATVSGSSGKDGADTTISGSYIKGVQSIKVEYKSDSEVYFNPGVIDVNNVLYENENKTTISGNLDANMWYYIYASISGTDLSFTMSSGIPTLDYDKMGYYNGDDRCIGFVLTNTSSGIRKYHIDGDRYHYYDNIITTIDWQLLTGDTNHDFDVHVPFGNMMVFANLYARSDTTSNTEFHIGTPGENNQVFWGISQGTDQSVYANNQLPVMCDSSKQLRLTGEGSDFKARVWTVGFQIPDYIYNPIGFSQLSGGGTSDVQTFLDLDDTPTSYSGTENQYLISTGSGIEFTQFSPANGNWILVKEINFDNTTYSGSIAWDGDTYPRARIETVLTKAPTSPDNFIFRFNNDDGNNYTHAYIVQNGTAVAASTVAATNNMKYALGSVASGRHLFATTDLYLKSGSRRHIMTRDNIYDSADTDRITGIYDNLWNNTADNITSFNIELKDASTGTIKIYRWQDITEIPVSKGKQSLKVEYATASGIYINPGTIHMKNSTFGMYELNERTEITVSGLAADTWYYVYTNVSGSTSSLDSGNFTVSSGVPTIDYPNMGYYSDDSRCIGCVLTDSSADFRIFKVVGNNYNFRNPISEQNGALTGYENVIHSVPFGNMSVNVRLLVKDSASEIDIYHTSSGLILAGVIYGRGDAEEVVVLDIECDSNKQIRYRSSASGSDTTSDRFSVNTLGFYLPDYIYTGA